MRRGARHRRRAAPRGTAAALLAALALVLLFAPRAGGDPPAPVGPDVEGLAFDAAGRLLAADLHADRVVVLGVAGDPITAFGAGTLEQPAGVAVAPGGDVFVTDADGVTRFGPAGAPVAAWPADEPDGIAVATDGTVLVSEEHAVSRFSATGVPLGRSAADRPRGIAVAADGTVWVAVTGALTHVTAAGIPLGTTPAGHPQGVAVAPDGTVLVAERERDRVVRVAPDGTPVATIDDGFDEPRGVAVDCRGAIAVSDDSPVRIHRIAAPGGGTASCAAVAAATPEPARPVARRPTVTPVPAPALLPALGRTALAASANGRVLVRAPGAREDEPLHAGTLVPMGARIDARGGRVALAFATWTADFDRLGTTQRGSFAAGVFTIRQRPGTSLVDVRLAGRAPRCSRGSSRRLVADVRGRFRMRGALATATATSARWVTEDRCGATLVRVTRGVVRVRDEVRGRSVRVRAGARVIVRRR